MKWHHDPWRLAAAPFTRWRLTLPAVALFAVLGGLWGYSTAIHSATITLVSRAEQQEFTSPDTTRVETLLEVARGSSLLQRVVESSSLSLTPEQVAASSELVPVGNTVCLTIRRSDPDETVGLANAFGQEIVRRFQEIQTEAGGSENRLLTDRLQTLDRELASETLRLIQFQESSGVTDADGSATGHLKQKNELTRKKEALELDLNTTDLQLNTMLDEIARQNPELVSTKEALARARSRYTDVHPEVKKLLAALMAIESRAAAQATNFLATTTGDSPLANSLYLQSVELRARQITLTQDLHDLARQLAQLDVTLAELPAKRLTYTQIRSRIEALENNRRTLSQNQANAELFVQHTGTPWAILEPANLTSLGAHRQAATTAALRLAGVGLVAAILLALMLELSDGRIRSAADLARVTDLPVIATLGDLTSMTPEEEQRWGFNTLAALRSQFDLSGSEALVCGFISAGPGEGRSTWVRLLADAAHRQGHPVLTISTDETTMPNDTPPPECTENPHAGSMALAAPREMANKLTTASGPASLHIPLPGRIWQIQCREQWKGALQEWKAIDNLVMLVDLPPACRPESVLLSEPIPQLVWLCDKDRARAPETEGFVTTLRHTRSRLAGAALNRSGTPRRRWSHFAASALVALACSTSLLAQEDPLSPPPPATSTAKPGQPSPSLQPKPGALSALSPDQLADWQHRLTLGPGDSLTVNIYGQPDTARSVTIGPDGRITYLQAQDFTASGLTIDEFRSELEKVLGEFHLSPRIVALPLAFNSKKYYLLGNVVQTGVYPLNRPISIVEAVARAHGFAAAPRNTLIMADLPHSFLVRKQADGTFDRVPVDFESLFLRGNLQANQPLAPDDFLYFPPIDQQDIYVLGEVGRPGVSVHHPGMTALRAVVGSGGFLEKAYKSRVLVVRGSLNNPETFVVDLGDILAAKEPDFPLKAGDIVYVARRPWAKAEELLESAVLSFIRGSVVAWTGQNIGPFITKPIF